MLDTSRLDVNSDSHNDALLPIPKRQVTDAEQLTIFAAIYDAFWRGGEKVAPWASRKIRVHPLIGLPTQSQAKTSRPMTTGLSIAHVKNSTTLTGNLKRLA